MPLCHRSLFGLLLALLCAGMAARAAANPSPLGPLPQGWTLSATDVLVLTSPETDAGTVTLILPPVTPAITDLRSAFGEDVPALIEDLIGETRASSSPLPLPPSDQVPPAMSLKAVVATGEEAVAHVEAIGFPVPGGMQLALLAYPAGMDGANPALLAARAMIEDWRAAGLVVSPDLATDVAARAAAPPTGDENESGETSAPPVPWSANPDDRVENVIYYLRYTFDGGGSVAPEPQSVTALLLKDGRVFENEPAAPAVFDSAKRPIGSPGTGRWQRDGEAYALAFADGTQGTAVAAAAKTFAAPAAMSLTGTYAAAGGSSTEPLPDRLTFFDDGSLTLAGNDATSRSARYRIGQRTFTIDDGTAAPRSLIFGFQGDRNAPALLIIGAQVYERADDAKTGP